MIEMIKKVMTIAIMVTMVGTFLGTGTMIIAHADDMSGSSTPYGITVATGPGLTADNIQIALLQKLTPTQQKCVSKCRTQGHNTAYCNGMCGVKTVT